jgi:CrcB protein
VLRFLLICLGGAIGTGARYLMTTWLAPRLSTALPFATLVINAIGSFLIAVVMFFATNSASMSVNTRLALTVGVLGGFTTYSSFNWETMQLIQEGMWRSAALHAVLMFVICLAAGFAGLAVAKAMS